MDLALFIRNRLKQLRLGQLDLARATRMAESYISQMPVSNSLQTAANRTNMHDQLERVLKLPLGQLKKVAEQQRREYLTQRLEHQPSPLLHRRAGYNSLLTWNGFVT